ncbi:MAG: hypothetical protein V9E81_10035 [Marmoricola sp.]
MEFIDVTQDEAGLRAWYEAYSAAGRYGKPHPMVWAFAEILAATAIDWPRRKLHHISAVVDGRVVAEPARSRFRNSITSYTLRLRCSSHRQIAAVAMGLPYWHT